MANVQPHLKLQTVDRVCLVSGNPDRIKIIANFLEDATLQSEYRGLISYKGHTPKNNVPVTLLTTGMGSPSTAIVIEEAYQAGARFIIRIGSCGSLQSGDPIGTLYIPHGAVRDEGTSKRFVPMAFPAVADPKLYQILLEEANKSGQFKTGLVWSSDVYYQKDTNYFKKWAKLGVNCVEMESSLIFSYQGYRTDLKAASILTSDGNLNDGINKYSGDIEENYRIFDEAVERSIEITINAIDHNRDVFF